MRTITHSEFQAASGEPVYVSTVHYASAAERKAGDAACQRVVVAAAFVPFGDKGEPFDPPETKPIYYCYPVSIKDARPQDCEGSDPCPSDKDATDYTTGPVSGGVTQKTHYNGIPIRLPNGKLNPLAISAVIRKVKADQMPPNCDGFGHDPAHVGQAMAHAQHEAAIDGDGCTAGACLLTRGSD